MASKLNVDPDEALDQVRLALEQEQESRIGPVPLSFFWGLILAKCLLAEWAIRTYEAPIRGFYVWAPTLLIAVAGTVVFGSHLWKVLVSRPATSRYLMTVWGGVGVASLLLLGATWPGAILPREILPGLLALVLGVGWFLHGALAGRNLYRVAALAWWVGALVLLARPGLDAVLGFSLLLLVAHCLPTGLRWWGLHHGG